MPNPVESLVCQRIQERGPLSFAEVMGLALYDPVHGYYGQGPPRIGRGGDFFTSVSVGPLFGRLIAMQAGRVWEAAGCPGCFTILEQGAHDGQLMEDVLLGLREMRSPLAASAQFAIIEPSLRYREAQAGRLLPELDGRLAWLDSPAEIAHAGQGMPGAGGFSASAGAFFYCNELLDAFPVRLLRWTGAEWRERGVVCDGGALAFEDMPLSSSVAPHIPPGDWGSLAPGHQIEVCPEAGQWLEALSKAMPPGAILIADYGLDDAEWLAPERAQGTLRRYRQHQMDDRVLEDLGQCDLTAHAPFGALKLCAAAHGLSVLADEAQGRFLTRVAADWLLSLEGEAPAPARHPWIRQFQALTHPGHLGGKFRVLLLEKA